MIDKKGSTLKNSFKDELEENTEERIEIKKPKKKNPTSVRTFQKVKDFVSDEKTQRISGVFFIFL